MKRMNYMNGNEHVVGTNDPFTSKVMGCAIQVHAGPGFLESVYHRALSIELSDAGIAFASQVSLGVSDKGRPAGNFLADIIVENRLLLESKAAESILTIHELQVVDYLKATDLALGLILNFDRPTLQIRRKFRDRPVPEDPLFLQNR